MITVAIAIAGLAAVWAPPAIAAPPPNDDFADAQELTSQNPLPIEVDGTTDEATYEPGEPDHSLRHDDGDLSPTHSVWYEWRPGADGPVTVDAHCQVEFPFGDVEQPVLVVYTGELGNLTRVAGNYVYDEGGPRICLDSFHADAEQTYRIAVDGDRKSVV